MLTMSNDSVEIEKEADVIASKITNILVTAFKEKENRDPTSEEVVQLLEELTEERINELLNNSSGDGEGSSSVDINSEEAQLKSRQEESGSSFNESHGCKDNDNVANEDGDDDDDEDEDDEDDEDNEDEVVENPFFESAAVEKDRNNKENVEICDNKAPEPSLVAAETDSMAKRRKLVA